MDCREPIGRFNDHFHELRSCLTSTSSTTGFQGPSSLGDRAPSKFVFLAMCPPLHILPSSTTHCLFPGRRQSSSEGGRQPVGDLSATMEGISRSMKSVSARGRRAAHCRWFSPPRCPLVVEEILQREEKSARSAQSQVGGRMPHLKDATISGDQGLHHRPGPQSTRRNPSRFPSRSKSDPPGCKRTGCIRRAHTAGDEAKDLAVLRSLADAILRLVCCSVVGLRGV